MPLCQCAERRVAIRKVSSSGCPLCLRWHGFRRTFRRQLPSRLVAMSAFCRQKSSPPHQSAKPSRLSQRGNRPHDRRPEAAHAEESVLGLRLAAAMVSSDGVEADGADSDGSAVGPVQTFVQKSSMICPSACSMSRRKVSLLTVFSMSRTEPSQRATRIFSPTLPRHLSGSSGTYSRPDGFVQTSA